MSEEDDFTVAGAAPTEVKAAAAVMALAGIFVALTGVQLLGARWYDEWRNYVPYVFMALGVGLIPLGMAIYRGSAKAAVTGLVVCLVATLSSCGWFVLTFGAVFSLMNVVAVPLATLGAVLCALSIKPTRRMTDARERLADQGLDLGF